MTSLASNLQNLNRIEAAFERAARFVDDPSVQADYVRYLCILVTGFLEQAVVSCVLNYVDAQGNPKLSAYVADSLQRPGSMKARNLLNLLGSFSDPWEKDLDSRLTERHRDAIGTIYANRNKIAHGEDVDLTYGQVHGEFALVAETVGFVEEIVDPA